MKKKQNGLFSSTLTYIIIFVLLVTGFAYYMRDNGTTSSQEIETSTFMSELKKGQCQKLFAPAIWWRL